MDKKQSPVFGIPLRALDSLFQAVRQMAPFFIGCFILMAILKLAMFWMMNHVLPFRRSEADPAGFLTNGGFILLIAYTILVAILWSRIQAAAAVGVHRFILLGEVQPGIFKTPLCTRRYTRWLAPIAVIADLAILLTHLGMLPMHFWPGTNLSLERNIFTILIVCLVLLFPAVAIDETSNGFWDRIKAALVRTREDFPLILGVVVIMGLPYLALLYGLAYLHHALWIGWESRDAYVAYWHTWYWTVFFAAVEILKAALAAAAASWLFRHATAERYSITAPAAEPVEPA